MDRADAVQKFNYPKSVFFIILTQFCDRFCYYGIKAVLTLYLRKDLGYDESSSTVFYHLFVMICYVVTIAGAIVADTCFGKYRTAVYFAVFYACGTVILSVSAVPGTLPQHTFSFVALAVIAIGCGCIKPCLSALGGDQFVRPQQERQLEQFFAISAFVTSTAMLIAIFVTPIFRENIECFGRDSCFPLAFGVPTIALAIGIALFLFGKRFYTIKEPEGNIMVDAVKCSAHAVYRKIKYGKTEQRNRWLDYASDKFDEQLIADIKQVFSILVLYVPVPIFWALNDQQGSRWTFQATRMDNTIGPVPLKPDQVQIISPILVVALVPVFESLVYPLFARSGLLTPLRKMGIGGVLAAIAFALSGLLELGLEPAYSALPEAGMTQFNFINSLPCRVNLAYTSENSTQRIELSSASHFLSPFLKDEPIEIMAQLNSSSCGDVHFTSTRMIANISGASSKAYSVIVFNNDGALDVKRMENEEPLEKDASGLARLNFIVSSRADLTGTISLTGPEDLADFDVDTTSNKLRLTQTETRTVDPGTYDVLIVPERNETATGSLIGKLEAEPGGCYAVFIYYDETSNATGYILPTEIAGPNTVSILWQIPQRFVVAVAEVMFSITGYQFSFTQAPPRMKAVIQGFWLLTIAFGNAIIMVVARAKLVDRQAIEFFLYAGLMVLDMLLFFYLACRYTYLNVEGENETDERPANDDGKFAQQSGGVDNEAFEITAF